MLVCSGEGSEVLGFLNFWEYFLTGRRPTSFEEGSAPGVRLHGMGPTECEAYHFGTKKKRPGSIWHVRDVIQRNYSIYL